MKKPLIHILRTSEKCYLYDLNTNKMVEISERLFVQLNKKENDISKIENEEVERLVKKGYLKRNHVRCTKHCETDYLPYYLENKMHVLILQVTRTCNLRCEYCPFSGTYQNRRHEEKYMSWDLAKRGIDYLLLHSRDSKSISLSFYGGEPLMAFPLIKKCIEYADKIFEGKEVKYNLTTNGTLLKDQILDYLVLHNVDVMISLDGPEEYHDTHRRFVNGNQGSFKFLISNVKKIKEKYPEYYKNCVTYNTVLDPERSFKKVDDFFKCEEIFADSHFSYSIIDDNYTDVVREFSDEFVSESNYTIFLMYLKGLGIVKSDNITKLYGNKLSDLCKIKNNRIIRREMPECSHHGGPCKTGLFHTFLNVNGDFYPCEKISELSECCKIGNIDTGIDSEKAKQLLNIGKITEDVCNQCWAYDYCGVCALHADSFDELSRDKVLKECSYVKRKLENMLLDCQVLEELGYDFETYSCFGRR